MLSMETLALARAYADKIKQQVGAGFTPQIVESLPTIGDSTILYLVLKEGTAPQGNVYDEYLWINGAYELIGNTATLMTVDSALSATSENPVQNKTVKAALDKKVDKVGGKGLSTNDFTTELKDKLDGVEAGANKTAVDAELSATSENPVQNKAVAAALDKKIDEPTNNGLVRKLMSGIYGTMGVDMAFPETPSDNNVPTTKLVADQLKNPLKLDDENLQKSGLILQSYTSPNSISETTGTTRYMIVQRDGSTLDDTITGMAKNPSSYAVGKYVKEKIAATTPSINESGNWVIGTTDTGVSAKGIKGDKGDKGDAGYSPTATVTQTASGAIITITDETGMTTATIKNGTDGGNTSATNIAPISTEIKTANGVTIAPDNGKYVVNGTATANTVYKIYDSKTALPSGVTAGKKYRIVVKQTIGSTVTFSGLFYDTSATSTQFTYTANPYLDTTLEIPENAVGLQIKFYVTPNHGALSNAYLEFGLYEIDTTIVDLKKNVNKLNTEVSGINLIPKSTETKTANGVTIAPSGEGYTVNGTATASTIYKIYDSTTELPEYIFAGETYAIAHNVDETKLSLIVNVYDGTNWTDTQVYNNSTIQIPANAVGLQIKFYVQGNKTYTDEFWRFELYSALSNRYVLNIMGAGEKSPKPMLTIIDDDGYKKFKTLLLPIVQSKKVPISSAVVASYANGEVSDYTDSVMNWTEVEDCYLKGAEILSHTYSHLGQAVAETMTKVEIQQDYQRAQYAMRKHGIKSEGLVFAGGSVDVANCQVACENVYSFGFKAYGDKINFKGSINPYKIDRYKIESNGSLFTETNLKNLIDTLSAGGTGWMVWMIHTSEGTFQQAQADIISTVIDYAIMKDIEIVTAESGARAYLY